MRIRVQRLVALVDLDLDVRDARAARCSRSRVGVGAARVGAERARSRARCPRRRARRSSPIAASTGVVGDRAMPSRVIAIQSPASIGPHSATLSRTAWVTSPVAHASTRRRTSPRRSRRAARRGRSATSAASASTTECVGTTPTVAIAQAVDLLARPATMFLLFGSTTHVLGRRSARTASRICAVDGFIDWPPGDHLLHADAAAAGG